MTPTEEQLEAIRAVSDLPRAIGCTQCHSYIQEHYGNQFAILRAMIDSSEHIREPPKMVGFDLEKARAADEALPYPLDAKEIWISRKGQMHINLPNAPSIFFTLSDLCEFRNIFHGQAAEIERLRAALDESEQILAHKTKTATHWYEEGLQTRADLVQCKRVVEQQAARIGLLEKELACHQM